MARPPKNNISINVNVNVNNAVASVSKLTGALNQTKDVAKAVGTTVEASIARKTKESVTESTKYLQNLMGSLINLKTLVKSVGLAMGVGFGVFAAGNILRNTYKTFETIEEGMHKIWTVANLTRQELKGLEQDLLELSKRSPLALEDIMSGAYYALSSGISVEELTRFMEIAERAAVAGYATIENTIDLLTTIRNAYGYSVEYMANVTDKLFAAMYVAKAEFSDFATNLGKVIPVASQLGISLDEILAGISTLTQVGIQTDKAATYLSQFFNSIINPSKQAATFAKELGIELSATAVSALGLTGYLNYLKEALQNAGYTTKTQMVTALTQLVGEARSSRAVLGLMTQDMDVYNKALQRIQNSIGDADEAYKKASDTLSKFFEKTKKSMAIWAASFVNGIDKIIEMFQSLKTTIPNVSEEVAKDVLEVAQNMEELENRLSATDELLQQLQETISSNISQYNKIMNEYANSLQGFNLALSTGDYDAKAQEIEKLKIAFKNVGISIDDTTTTLEGLNKALIEHLETQKKLVEQQYKVIETNYKNLQQELKAIEEQNEKYMQQRQLLSNIQQSINNLSSRKISAQISEALILSGSNMQERTKRLKAIANEYMSYVQELEKQLPVLEQDERFKIFVPELQQYVKQVKEVFNSIINARIIPTNLASSIATQIQELNDSVIKATANNIEEAFNMLDEAAKGFPEKIEELREKINLTKNELTETDKLIKSYEETITKAQEGLQFDYEDYFKDKTKALLEQSQMFLNAFVQNFKNAGIQIDETLQGYLDAFTELINMSPEEVATNPEQFFKNLTTNLKSIAEYMKNNSETIKKSFGDNVEAFEAFWDIYSKIISNFAGQKNNLMSLLGLDPKYLKNSSDELYSLIGLFNEINEYIKLDLDVSTETLSNNLDELYKLQDKRIQAAIKATEEESNAIKSVAKEYAELKKQVTETKDVNAIEQLLEKFEKLKEKVTELKLEFAGTEHYFALGNLQQQIDNLVQTYGKIDFSKSFQSVVEQIKEKGAKDLEAEYKEIMSYRYPMLQKEYALNLALAQTDEERKEALQKYMQGLQDVLYGLKSIEQSEFVTEELTKQIQLNKLNIKLEIERINDELNKEEEITYELTEEEQKRYEILKQQLEVSKQFNEQYSNILQKFSEIHSEMQKTTDTDKLNDFREELEDLVTQLEELSLKVNKTGNIANADKLANTIILIRKEIELITAKTKEIEKNMEKLTEIKKSIEAIQQYSHLFDEALGEGAGNFINALSSGTLDSLEKMKDEIASGDKDFGEAFGSALLSGFENALPELERYFESLGTDFGDFMAHGIEMVEWAQLGAKVGQMFGDPFVGAVVGLIIGLVDWIIDAFKSEWDEMYEEIRSNLPKTITNALASAKTPEQLKENLKNAIFDAAYKGLLQAFMQTEMMKQFMDNISEYMTSFLLNEMSAEKFKQLVEQELGEVNFEKLSEALSTFYEAMEEATDTAKATEESLAYSSVRAVTEQTANVMVSYLRDMRDTLRRIEDVSRKIESNTKNFGGGRIPYRGTKLA